jgi:sensor histidine kinase YesM
MQLNPHFLFNTLNTVSSLMLRDTGTASQVLARLGDLLRVSLDTSGQQLVPLRQELEFLGRYLEIEQARFGDRLTVQLDVPSGLLDATVPNLLLQPLVENAVRHGVEQQSAPGGITVRAALNNGSLVLEVTDTGPGLAKDTAIAGTANGHGIGLANTRERLRQLYGDRQQLTLREREGGGLVVSISLPYETSAPGTAN